MLDYLVALFVSLVLESMTTFVVPKSPENGMDGRETEWYVHVKLVFTDNKRNSMDGRETAQIRCCK